jgi:hypothetical protein
MNFGDGFEMAARQPWMIKEQFSGRNTRSSPFWGWK